MSQTGLVGQRDPQSLFDHLKQAVGRRRCFAASCENPPLDVIVSAPMGFLAGLPLLRFPERQNGCLRFAQTSEQRAPTLMDRRSALLFLFSAIVPVVAFLCRIYARKIHDVVWGGEYIKI